MTNPRGISG